MYKKGIIALCLISGLGAALYFNSAKTVIPETNDDTGLQDPREEDGGFNHQRTVCLEQREALRSNTAGAMRQIGAQRTFNKTEKRKEYVCFTKYFYNPNKDLKATIDCSGRRMKRSCDVAFGSLQQTSCCINFINNAPNKFKNKIRYPENSAEIFTNTRAAINALNNG